ncbi:MAG: PIN domain-containing protein [Candidatus Pacebacteria bacterium]|nr:PIN domain-containing protein [Candidatus Paceibacterota bacterium]
MAGNKEIVCWDASTILNFINADNSSYKGQGATPAELQAMKETVLKAEKRELLLITPAIWRLEVLPSNSEQVNQKLVKAFNGKAILSVEIGQRIIDIAFEIRNYYINQSTPRQTFSSPDCIYLATAIVYGACEFITFDDQLLKLSPSVVSYSQKITRPITNQGSLFYSP